MITETSRLDYEYEIECEYDFLIDFKPVTFPEPSLFMFSGFR